jgi:hypothetical protein
MPAANLPSTLETVTAQHLATVTAKHLGTVAAKHLATVDVKHLENRDHQALYRNMRTLDTFSHAQKRGSDSPMDDLA